MATDTEIKYRRVTAVQTVTWVEWDERQRRFEHHVLRAAYGNRDAETGDMPETALAHLDKVVADEVKYGTGSGTPRVLPEEDYADWIADERQKVAPEMALSDEQIKAMTADNLMAALTQNNALAPRVIALEEQRTRPRKPILAHANRILAAQAGEDVSLADKPAGNLLTLSEP
jgi:hypothetical protein